MKSKPLMQNEPEISLEDLFRPEAEGLTRDEIFQLHQKLSARALHLMRSKNEDYCLRGPFDNFMLVESFGICSAEQGILVRLLDKLSRLHSIFEKGARVEDESEDDTIVDIINYAVLLAGLRRNRGRV